MDIHEQGTSRLGLITQSGEIVMKYNWEILEGVANIGAAAIAPLAMLAWVVSLL